MSLSPFTLVSSEAFVLGKGTTRRERKGLVVMRREQICLQTKAVVGPRRSGQYFGSNDVIAFKYTNVSVY